MPYYIRKGMPGCAAWATVKSDGTMVTCHKTKSDAINHMVALSIATNEKPGGTYGKKKESVIEAMIREVEESIDEV